MPSPAISTPGSSRPPFPSSLPPISPAFASDDSGLSDADDDLYDDGTDIIDIPVLPSKSSSVPAPPLPSALQPPRRPSLESERESRVSGFPSSYDEVEEELGVDDVEVEPYVESEVESEVPGVDTDRDFKSYAGDTFDDEIEEERQSLLSDELEPYDAGDAPPETGPVADTIQGVVPAGDGDELQRELERQAKVQGVRVEPDESEDEPTHKLRMDEVSAPKSERNLGLADKLRPSFATPSPAPGEPRPSLAEELEPDEVPRRSTLGELVRQAGGAVHSRRSEGSPSSRPSAKPDGNDKHTQRSRRPSAKVPASISPRAGSQVPTRAASVPAAKASKPGRSQAPPSHKASRRPEAKSKRPASVPGSPASRRPRASTSKSSTERESRPSAPLATERDRSPAASQGPRLAAAELESVRGLEDLPEEAQEALAANSRIENLMLDEELNGFAVALILQGRVKIMPAIVDATAAEAGVGEVVFTEGHLTDGVMLRVVAAVNDTRVAYWDSATLNAQIANCPWVDDDLRSIADRFQALSGAAMGSLGERLDDSLRAMVTERCEVLALGSGEVLLEAGGRVNGMYVLGAGHLELYVGETVKEQLYPGDFLFAAQVMAGGGAPFSARAGAGGALLLRAERMAAHELLVSVPPLLEILAG